MVAVVKSVALTGYEGTLIEVEADLRQGLPSLQIVGMGNKAVNEAKERVKSAVRNANLDFPARKLTVNLAPAELPKDGTHLDLPIALSILVASGQMKQREVDKAVFVGELALDGHLRPVRGTIIAAEVARVTKNDTVYVPLQNAAQAQLVDGIQVVGVGSLAELFWHLRRIQPLDLQTPTTMETAIESSGVSLDDIRGQESAKRALAIAAAGQHNILLSGPPGTGKSMLAKRLPSLLPPLEAPARLEATKLHSLRFGDAGVVITAPPFRSPHHSSTVASVIGGGSRPQPGEISLAHKGVLFLDELPEYPRVVLEALRQPLEDRTIHVSRAHGQTTYPADVLLIATMNPCPCGYLDDPTQLCTCTAGQIQVYQKKLSGPLLDRIDLYIDVRRVSFEDILATDTSIKEQHSKVSEAVIQARNRQKRRYGRCDIYNSHATPSQVQTHFSIEPAALHLARSAATKLALSTRAYYRLLRVARTIADLARHDTVTESHVAEALQFRGNRGDHFS